MHVAPLTHSFQVLPSITLLSPFINTVRMIRFNRAPNCTRDSHHSLTCAFAYFEAAAVVPQVVFSSQEFRDGIPVVKSNLDSFHSRLRGANTVVVAATAEVYHFMRLQRPARSGRS